MNIWYIAAGIALIVLAIIIWQKQKQPMASAQAQAVTPSAPVAQQQQQTPAAPVVYELTAEDVPSILQKRPVVVIMVYSPRCVYCQKMEPEYAKAASIPGNNITWARLNAEDHKQAAENLGINKFPTTLCFQNGRLVKTIPGATTAPELLSQVQ